MSPAPSRREALLCSLAPILLSAAMARAQEASGEEPAEQAAEVQTSEESWRRPLGSRNQTPLALLFVYLTPESAAVIPRGGIELDVVLDYSNIILDQRTESESELVRFDLEYLRTLVSLRRGFAGGFELGASLPFYLYYGGFLDPFVSGFHEALGLPNFLRGQTPNGLVDYQYRRGGEALVSGQESFGAAGDLSLHAKKELLRESRSALALRGTVKLPTGKLRNLSGSGAADFGLGVAFHRIGDRFGLYANANYHFLGEALGLETRDFFSFMAGADWRFKPNLVAVMQVDVMRPPLGGELLLLNEAGAQLALGIRWRYSERFLYEWRLVEDLSSFSPDFTFAFQVGVRFEGTD